MYCSRYSKITKCTNCNSDIDDNAICNTCGMEFLYSDIICIEENYKKNYSCSFHEKQTKHNPYKHCKNWLLKLQGNEVVNISSENFNKILDCARKWLDQNETVELSCSVIRNWLKLLSLTKYNTHITWLRKEIESGCNIKGHSYELSSDEISDILNYFSQIIAQFSALKQDPKVHMHNIAYYPFFIAKILSLVIHNKNRLNTLLSNVHSQNKKTLAKNEYIWDILSNNINNE